MTIGILIQSSTSKFYLFDFKNCAARRTRPTVFLEVQDLGAIQEITSTQGGIFCQFLYTHPDLPREWIYRYRGVKLDLA